MADLYRVRVEWGAQAVVGPGVSTFHFTAMNSGVIAGLMEFFEKATNVIPSPQTITIPTSGEILDVATGQATGTWTQAGGATKTGQGQSNYASGVGCRVRWETGGFNEGRRVRGSTFLVPLSANIYDTDGTLTSAAVTQLNQGAGSLVSGAAGAFVVYSRGPGPATGRTSAITSGAVRDKTSWLLSRRR